MSAKIFNEEHIYWLFRYGSKNDIPDWDNIEYDEEKETTPSYTNAKDIRMMSLSPLMVDMLEKINQICDIPKDTECSNVDNTVLLRSKLKDIKGITSEILQRIK